MIPDLAAAGLHVRSYPVMLLIAALAGLALATPRLRRIPGIHGTTLVRLALFGCLGAWLGGRIHHLSNLGAFGWRRIVVDGRYAELFGFSFHAGGAVLGLVVAVAVFSARHRLPLGRLGDAIVPGFGIGLALGRFACFLNGCCTGTTCDHPWCVAFPKPTNVWNYHVYRGFVPGDATWSAPVHPLQLYFTAVGLVILALGYVLDRTKRYDGQSALVALAVFAASNLALEHFRGYAPARRLWYGVPQLTWVALATLIVTVAVLAVCEWRHRRVRTTPIEAAA